MALRSPTIRINPLSTYNNRSMRESQRVKGLRSKVSPKEACISTEHLLPGAQQGMMEWVVGTMMQDHLLNPKP